jgi:hypothetical protein
MCSQGAPSSPPGFSGGGSTDFGAKNGKETPKENSAFFHLKEKRLSFAPTAKF